jgi:hypothetical protein
LFYGRNPSRGAKFQNFYCQTFHQLSTQIAPQQYEVQADLLLYHLGNFTGLRINCQRNHWHNSNGISLEGGNPWTTPTAFIVKEYEFKPITTEENLRMKSRENEEILD